MLIQVIPDRVAEHWEFFSQAIGDALPPHIYGTKEGLASILRAVLIEKMQVWVYQNDEGKPAFVLTTTTMVDPVTGWEALMVYTVKAVYGFDNKMWDDTFETLKGFADGQGIKSIVGFLDNEPLARYYNSKGGDTSLRFVTFTWK